MKVVFMGTPEIASGVLKELIASKHEVAAVVTQPDRPNARGNAVVWSDVKKTAVEAGIEVLQPEKASEETFVERLREIAPDIIVVVAYGQILRSSVLDLPKYRCINVHASLLPKYRGASPIQWAVINGEKVTGVTIMYMEKGLDTGDIILQEKLELAADETAGSLHDRLMNIAGPTLLKAMDMIEDGTACPIKQDDSLSNYVSVLTKSMGNIDFNSEPVKLERLIRGLIPWPGAFTYIEGKLVKLFSCSVSDRSYDGRFEAGRYFTVDDSRLFIEAANGSLEIGELQLEGKKRMRTSDFLRGHKLTVGMTSREA